MYMGLNDNVSYNVRKFTMPDGSEIYFKDFDSYNGVSNFPATGKEGFLYIDTSTNIPYRWNGTTYVAVASVASDFTGATSSSDGVHGFVPAPLIADRNKFLKGDGTWETVGAGSDMTGATASTDGTHGLVPAPLAGEQTKVLTGGGTWEVAPGARLVETTGTVTNVSGSYTGTFNNADVTADMKAIKIELGTPSVFRDNISVTCNAGSVTVSCSDVVGTSTIKIYTIKSAGDAQSITSAEFDILDARIQVYENLFTVQNGKVCITYEKEVEE